MKAKTKHGKRVYLASGSEEGFYWALSLEIYEKTKSFLGLFDVTGKLGKQRIQIRSRDRKFFEARVGGKYMSDKVLHHSWIRNSAEYTKVVLLDKSEHPNGGIDVPRDRRRWIEKENWLNTCQ